MNSRLVAVILSAAMLSAAAVLPAQVEEKRKVDQDPQPKVAAETNPKVLIKTSLGDITLELFARSAPKTVANFVGLAEGTKEYTDQKGKKTKGHYYDGLKFHRVIPKFMAQGGCPLGNGTGGPGYSFTDEINAKGLGLDRIKAITGNRPHQFLMIRSQQEYQTRVLRPLFRKLGIKSQKELDAKRKELDAALKNLTLADAYANMGYKYDEKLESYPMTRGTIAMANSGPSTNGSQFFINMVDNVPLNGKHTVFGRVIAGMDVIDKMQTVKMKGPSAPEVDIKIVSIRRVGEIPIPSGDAAKDGQAGGKKGK